MRTAVYTRVNVSNDQDARLAAQLLACHRWMSEQGDEFAGTYSDESTSGMELERPGLARLFKDFDAGKFDRVIMAQPVVAARGAQTFHTILQRFRTAHVPLFFADVGSAERTMAALPALNPELYRKAEQAAQRYFRPRLA